MDKLRTPDARFGAITDFPYRPQYMEIDDFDGDTLRLAYLDEGPRTARPILLFHGEPTWSYLYRRMIPVLLAAGHRVLVPDLIGMGRSDKPTRKSDYSFARHVGWMLQWLRKLDLADAIWFGQDWGSVIGLAMVMQEPDRFAAIVLANGTLPDPDNVERWTSFAMRSPHPESFPLWQAWIRQQAFVNCGDIVADGLPLPGQRPIVSLSSAEREAYNAPFPNGQYQAGVLAFPFLADDMGPEGVRYCREGWQALEGWQKPFITAFGKADVVLGWADDLFHQHVPGARGQPHRRFEHGNHFIQEEEPQALCAAIEDAIRAAEGHFTKESRDVV